MNFAYFLKKINIIRYRFHLNITSKTKDIDKLFGDKKTTFVILNKLL